MAQWMELRKKWDGAVAKRARLGRALAPKDQKAYDAFLKNPFRKVVFDTVLKTHIPRPSKATASSLKNSIVVELRMDLDPAHLGVRFNAGPYFHLFVKEFEVAEAPAFVTELHEHVKPDHEPTEMPADPEENQGDDENELSENEQEFADIHPDIVDAFEGSAPKAAWAKGSCHDDGADIC